MPNNIYTIKKGEKYPIQITVRNRDLDEPINLTGSQIKFQIKDELTDDFFVIDKLITEDTDEKTIGRIIDPVQGKVIVSITDEDFEKLTVERVYYLTIWWEKPIEEFAKVISSNGCENLRFMVCHP